MHTDRVLDTESVELSLRKTAPNLGLVDLVGIVHATIERHDVFDENIDSLGVLLVLLEDEERFLVQAMLNRDPGDLGGVVVLELVDVANDLALVRADGCQHQQVLEVAVVAERRWLQDDLLQQLDELERQVSSQECLDSDRDIVGVGALGQRRCHDLVDELTTVHVVGTEDLGPQIRLTTADEVARLLLEHRILVRDMDELVITEALRVCDVGQVGIAGLAEFADNERFVQLW